MIFEEFSALCFVRKGGIAHSCEWKQRFRVDIHPPSVTGRGGEFGPRHPPKSLDVDQSVVAMGEALVHRRGIHVGA